MPMLSDLLELDRCPHCRVDKPTLTTKATFWTAAYTGANKRFWRTYMCSRCGGVVTASSEHEGWPVQEMFPATAAVSEAIPEPARSYLNQAIGTLHAPAGSVMLSASAVDAMLKARSIKEGSLYSRINNAAKNHLITHDMAQWAHDVRLDANEQRHADEEAALPTQDDARRCAEFALALGEFLFVLPSRVKRGLAEASTGENAG